MAQVPPIDDSLDLATSTPTHITDDVPFANAKRSVAINPTALDQFALEITNSILANKSLEVTEWDADGWHYTGKKYNVRSGTSAQGCVHVHRELMRMERVALYILAMDAINFCFWPVSEAKDATNSVKNGLEYEHLAIGLRKLAELDDGNSQVNVKTSESGGITVRSANSYALSPTNLAELTPKKLHDMIQPHFPPSTNENGTSVVYELPDMQIRCQLLNELGKGLLEQHGGSALQMISKANQSADALVRIIMDTFPGFRDYVDTDASGEWETVKASLTAIHLHKRAQIATADIWAALGRCNDQSVQTTNTANPEHAKLFTCCHFTDMDAVTTFPDYRVPQILRHVAVLRYGSQLANLIDNQLELEKSGMDEVSIRASTVVAVEELVHRVKKQLASISLEGTTLDRNNLQKLSDDVSAVTIDWYLWQKGERLDRANQLEPHHRVRTTFY